MSTALKALPANNPFGLVTSTSSTPQTSCNICKRLLYAFEEILVCRLCRASYHWRCVKPDPISHYGENTNFTCAKCSDNMKATTSNTTHWLSNGSLKIKSSDLSEIDYRDFVNVPSKSNAMSVRDSPVGIGIRQFEDKQQQQTSTLAGTEVNESNDQVQSQLNGRYIDDSKTISQFQEGRNPRENGDENTITTEMFQAHYQYTPLTEFAASRTDPTTNENNSYINQSSSPTDSDHQSSARYVCNVRYRTNDYEPPKSRIPPPALNSSANFTSPINDNLSNQNRQKYFISTTNLNVDDGTYRRQQQENIRKNPVNYSTSYLPQLRDDDFATFKYTYRQQATDRNSAVGSDSGIVTAQPSHHYTTKDDIQIADPKLSAIVEQLERQLETDTTKINEKLETKLKSLETMINQQTFIIDKQDKVIEDLKGKISKIETERNNFRDRLSTQEQREQDDKKYLISTDIGKSQNNKTFEQNDIQRTLDDVSTNRKYSNTSSVATDISKRSSKKPPAPRIDLNGSLNTSDNEPVLAKLIKSQPTYQERTSSNASNASAAAILAACVPLIEPPAASNRLDNIIHQSDSDDVSHSKSVQYNLAEVHQQLLKNQTDQSPVEEQISISIHQDEEQTEGMNTSDLKANRSSSVSASTSTAVRQDADLPLGNSYLLPPKKNATHRSLEELSHKLSQEEQGLRPNNKATSLEFSQKPMEYNDPGSIYFNQQGAPYPASSFQNNIKGYLNKKNIDSFFKRMERYYCVLKDNALLMYKRENDQQPYKGIQLEGAKIRLLNDPKVGQIIELTWSLRANKTKHYQLHSSNPNETQAWFNGIQAVMQNQ